MPFIWKPPAVLILCSFFLVVFVGGGIAFADLNLFEDPNRGTAIVAGVTGLGIIGSDVWFRRSHGLGLFSLEASTIFFVIPTWTVGVPFLLMSMNLLGQ